MARERNQRPNGTERCEMQRAPDSDARNLLQQLSLIPQSAAAASLTGPLYADAVVDGLLLLAIALALMLSLI